jgi:hypothetical protein
VLSETDINIVELVDRDFMDEGRYGPGVRIYDKGTKEELRKINAWKDWSTAVVWLMTIPMMLCWSTGARWPVIGIGVAAFAVYLVASSRYSKRKYTEHIIDGRGCSLWQGVLDDLIPYQDTHPVFVKRTALRLVEDYERWEAMNLICDERSKQSLHDWYTLVNEFVDNVLKGPTAQLNERAQESREWLILNMVSRQELDEIDVTVPRSSTAP